MIDFKIPRKNSEKIIINEQVPIRAALSCPFDNPDDLILKGNFKKISKGQLSFEFKETVSFFGMGGDLPGLLGANKIENAKKDLLKNPQNPFLLNTLALAYFNNGDKDKALSLFKKAITLKKGFSIASLNLASVYMSKNDIDSAFKIYKELNLKNPDDSRVLLNIGNIYLRKNDFKKAKDIFIQIISKDKRNVAATNKLAIIHLGENQYDKAISLLRDCLEININLPSIYNNMGVAYALNGSLRKAIKALRISLKISPFYTSAINNLATAYKQNKQLDEAIELIENYLVSNTNDALSEKLVKLYINKGQHKKALNILQKLLENAKSVNVNANKIARLYNNLGVIYHKMKEYKKANENYHISLNKKTQVSSTTVANIIDLYFDQNKINKMKEYIEILQYQCKDDLYIYYLGLLAMNSKDMAEAQDHLKLFLSKNKRFLPAYGLLSFLYSEFLFNYTKAINLNNEAIKNLPNDEILINNLAYNHLMNDDIESAKKILNKLTSFNGPYLNATRGLLAIKEGNLTEGRRLYNLASQLTPDLFLQKQIIQKKHIELAKYYIANNNTSIASDNIDKALSVKVQYNVYSHQASQLKDSLNLPK